MEEHHKSMLVWAAIGGLVVGGAIGYTFGSNRGADAIDDEAALADEVAARTNPFAGTESAVESGYVNPFKQSSNPFAQ